MREQQDGGNRQHNYNSDFNRTGLPYQYPESHDGKVMSPNGKRGARNQILSTVVAISRKPIASVRRVTKKIWPPIWKRLKILPWKLIVSIVIILFLILAMLFHFYIASTSRILGVFEEKLVTAALIEEEIQKTSIALQKIQPYETDVANEQAIFQEMEGVVSESDLSLPPKFVANYALNKDDDMSEQLDVLYENEFSTKRITRLSQDTSLLLEYNAELFSKDIQEDTQGYIDFMRQTVASIEELGANNSDVDVSVILRIYRQILDSAEQYRVNEDIDNFNFQTNNVASELYKEVNASWSKTMDDMREKISAQRSSLESVVNRY